MVKFWFLGRARAAWLGAILFTAGCADTHFSDDGGAGDGMDAAQTPPEEAGAPVEDAATPEGDAAPAEDAGPLDTSGRTCSPCHDDADCESGHGCAPVGAMRLCLPSCDAGESDCPAGFGCVESLVEGSPVCAPVGERCCVDEDEDGYGDGVGCLAQDCDDDDPNRHPGAEELCDGLDNDCDEEIDEGDPMVLCPPGEHVVASVCADGGCVIDACEPGFADCDGDPSNGCETPTTVESSCGACGVGCEPANAVGDCSSGTCRVGSCDAGFADCDGDPSNGCETPLDTLTDCGACGRSCAPAGADGDCSSGTCQIAACHENLADCDMDPTNGCETSLRTNEHCGACERMCRPTGGTGDCSTGTCRITSCSPGSADCDMDPSNGCETNTRTVSDCGGCGITCSHDRGISSCASGACTLIGCGRGYGNCDGNDENGCEQELNTLDHCGACGHACSFANGAGRCSNGNCVLLSCDPGWGNCDGDDSNGCEQALDTLAHCGACDNACVLPDAAATCSSGSCQIEACAPLRGDCDGQSANGCETSLETPSDCNACGVPCTRPNADTSCSGGSCRITGCHAGFSNCDGDASNGCERRHSRVSGSCGGGDNVGAFDGDRNCHWNWCREPDGWDLFATRTGHNSSWYRARVVEDSNCSSDIEHRIHLTVPSGIDYDLYVYRSCGTVVGQSRRGTGQSEEVIVRQAERSGRDDSFDYNVEVRYHSGRSCQPFTIRFYGHNC